MAAETTDEPVAAPSQPPRGVHDMTQGSVRAHVVRMMVFVLAGPPQAGARAEGATHAGADLRYARRRCVLPRC